MAEEAWPEKRGAQAGQGGSKATWRTWLRRGLVSVELLALLWLAFQAGRAAWAGLAARQDLARIEELAQASSLDVVPLLEQDLVALDTHVATVRSAGRPFLLLASHLGWLPGVGPDVQAAPALVEMAAALASGGREGMEALRPVTDLIARRGQGDLLAQAVPALAVAAPRLTPAGAHLAEAEAWRARISGPLSPGVARLLDRVDRVLPLARAGLQAAQVAPALLGMNEPRTYLILAQNNHELRATGGFISGAGIVRFDSGRITALRMADSYAVDNLKQPHPDAPRVLAEQMGAQLLLLRDSNWSPDFPISAQIARTLYEQDQGVATDGAIAVDIEAVRLLLSAMDPVPVPGMAQPLTSENLIDQMKLAYTQPAAGQAASGTEGSAERQHRKDFMGPLMTAALSRLETGQGFRPAALARALVTMLEGRHLQIAVDAAEPAALLARSGWDGAMRLPAQGDLLAIVDSNLSLNKTNAAVQQGIEYQVAAEGKALTATLTVTYTHTAKTHLDVCNPAAWLYATSYDDMIGSCYWDYVRVYVPGDSMLIESEGLQKSGVEPGEKGAAVLVGNFVLRPAEAHVVRLRYRLPEAMGSETYRLFVRKQAGTGATPLRVQAGPCRWDTDLARDRTFACSAWGK